MYQSVRSTGEYVFTMVPPDEVVVDTETWEWRRHDPTVWYRPHRYARRRKFATVPPSSSADTVLAMLNHRLR